MSGFLVWLIDIYSGALFTLAIVSIVVLLFGLILQIPDLSEEELIFKSWHAKGIYNKISIMCVVIGVCVLLLCVFMPSKKAFVYMVGADEEQLTQIYQPSWCVRLKKQ